MAEDIRTEDEQPTDEEVEAHSPLTGSPKSEGSPRFGTEETDDDDVEAHGPKITGPNTGSPHAGG